MDEVKKILRGMNTKELDEAMEGISQFLTQENVRRRMEAFLNENYSSRLETVKIEFETIEGDKVWAKFKKSGVVWEWEK